jgi:polysaccharide export outer membrane protein
MRKKILALLPSLFLFFFVIAFVIAVAEGLGAQAAPAAMTGSVVAVPERSDLPPLPATSSPLTPRAAVRLGPGDLLEISVYGVPELTQRVRVANSGEVSLPLIDRVPLAGRTVEEAQSEIERLLVEGGYLNQPHVSILVLEFGSGVNLLGEISRPGIYPAPGSRRLLDIIAAAGGLTANAGRVITISHRERPDDPETVILSSDPKQTLQRNVDVLQGDTIIVSRAGVVYVVGEVQQPSGFIMESSQTLTVLKAIAMAHGTTRVAALDKSRVIRKQSTGQVQEIPIPLKKILQAKAPDLPLQADDIVFVPSSKGKNIAVRSLETLVQIGTGISIRRF